MNEIIASSFKTAKSQLDNAFGWFDITVSDRERVSALEPLVAAHIDEIVDDFYERAGGFDHPTRRIADTDHLEAIRDEQKRHFMELLDAGLDEAYYSNRATAGIFNERSGVSPTFYMGAYSHFIKRVCQLVRETSEDSEATLETILSLSKVASCHKALTLEAFASAREETIEDRERQLSELPTPVLRLREGLLLVPVVGTLDTHRARLLTIQMLEAIRDMNARAVVLDITGVAAVDSAVANHLMQTMTAARLMGADAVLTGITAEVAQALVKIGVTGETLNPAGSLQRGIEIATRLLDG